MITSGSSYLTCSFVGGVPLQIVVLIITVTCSQEDTQIQTHTPKQFSPTYTVPAVSLSLSPPSSLFPSDSLSHFPPSFTAHSPLIWRGKFCLCKAVCVSELHSSAQWISSSLHTGFGIQPKLHFFFQLLGWLNFLNRQLDFFFYCC